MPHFVTTPTDLSGGFILILFLHPMTFPSETQTRPLHLENISANLVIFSRHVFHFHVEIYSLVNRNFLHRELRTGSDAARLMYEPN